MADEYISRKDAMEYLYRAINADPDGNCPNCVHDEHDCQYDRCWTLMDLCEKIEYLGYVPAADVVPVRNGRNISSSGFLCSECHFGDFGGFHGYKPKYCPNCGAKMDGEA